MKLSAIRNYFKCINFSQKYYSTDSVVTPQSNYDAIIIGGGHNGLVAAGYMQRNGMQVCVLEKRHIVGGAAVTEEIVPGFKFSRASYVLSLLRPEIYQYLELKKYGLKVHLRNPSSYTPLHETFWKDKSARSLTLGSSESDNVYQISQFSERDARMYRDYEEQLQRIVQAFDPILDLSPAVAMQFMEAPSLWQKLCILFRQPQLAKAGVSIGRLGGDLPAAWELLTAPIRKVLDRWFESEPLRATLATDALIGAMLDTNTPGSGYVLLHHVMGELEGIRGAWGYPEGGMGAVTQALAASALAHGSHIFTNQHVKEIFMDGSGIARGVVTEDETEIKANVILSCATPQVTFLKLLPEGCLPREFRSAIQDIDYTSPVTKINVALSRLPDFFADPCLSEGKPMPHHQTTIHLNCEHTTLLDEAYLCAKQGKISEKPMIEMVLPSVLDKTLAPDGAHVCLLFTQFTPYHLPGGWGEDAKELYVQKIFNTIEEYAPGFKESVVGKEVLPPPELEKIFGLTGGNIFHGAMSLDQLFLCRPTTKHSPPHYPYTPVQNVLLCGSGAHPGGGVMGAPGRIAALAALQNFKKR